MSLKLLDTRVLSKISNLALHAHSVVEGFIAGQHRSPYHGWSLEFAQHREYSPGDEPKHIDWKVYARSDRYYVKQYEEETNLRAYVVLDCSSSMSYKSSDGLMTKFEYAQLLSAALAYLMTVQRDAVGAAFFSESTNVYLPPRNTVAQLSLITEKLENCKPVAGTNLAKMLPSILQKIKKRGVVIIISDLFDEPEKLVKNIRYFQHKKHEVIVFHVLDPMELTLPEGESVTFENIETSETVLTEPAIIQVEYQRIMKEFTEYYRKNFTSAGIDYCVMPTSCSMDKALGLYLTKRHEYGDS
ncbi:MAG: DUF58 domain-containing protein [Elusimicrobiota bacterium]